VNQVPGTATFGPSHLIAVLVTVLVCMALTGLIIWYLGARQRRQTRRQLSTQREQQEEALDRVLRATAQDDEKMVNDYEIQIAALDERIQTLESENARLRDRLASSGVMGLFGGRQKESVSALLLENEQLHELLAAQQAQMAKTVRDMSDRWVSQIEQQAQESARAVRYKQALLSAFLQQRETRQLLDGMLAGDKLGRSLPSEDTEG